MKKLSANILINFCALLIHFEAHELRLWSDKKFSSVFLLDINRVQSGKFCKNYPRELQTAGSSFYSFATVHGPAAAPSFVTLTLSWELLAVGDKRQFTKLHECSESAQDSPRPSQQSVS